MSTKPDSATGWSNKFTSAIGYYFVRERGEDPADASIIEYQGSERAYISGADDNFYKEWSSGRFEFLGPFTASDFEQLIRLRKVGRDALATIQKLINVLDLKTQRGMAIDADNVASALREALANTGDES